MQSATHAGYGAHLWPAFNVYSRSQKYSSANDLGGLPGKSFALLLQSTVVLRLVISLKIEGVYLHPCPHPQLRGLVLPSSMASLESSRLTRVETGAMLIDGLIREANV